jgi:ribosome-associated protein
MQFKLKNQDYIELVKLLKFMGLAESGTEAKMIIDAGDVRVNGNLEFRRRCKIRPGDKVEFDGETIEIS